MNSAREQVTLVFDTDFCLIMVTFVFLFLSSEFDQPCIWRAYLKNDSTMKNNRSLFFYRWTGKKVDFARRKKNKNEKENEIDFKYFLLRHPSQFTHIFHQHHPHDGWRYTRSNYLHNACCRTAPTFFFQESTQNEKKKALPDAWRTASNTSRVATEPMSSTHNLVTIVFFLSFFFPSSLFLSPSLPFCSVFDRPRFEAGFQRSSKHIFTRHSHSLRPN